MNTIYIDFSEIGDEEDFYTQLKEKTNLPTNFGENLDALYDVATGFWELPMKLEWVNLSIHQLEIFDEIIATLEDSENDCEDFHFTYFLEQYEDK